FQNQRTRDDDVGTTWIEAWRRATVVGGLLLRQRVGDRAQLVELELEAVERVQRGVVARCLDHPGDGLRGARRSDRDVEPELVDFSLERCQDRADVRAAFLDGVRRGDAAGKESIGQS